MPYFLHSHLARPKTLQKALSAPHLLKLRKAWLPGHTAGENSTVVSPEHRSGEWQVEGDLQGVVYYVDDAADETRLRKYISGFGPCEVKDVQIEVCRGGFLGRREWTDGKAFVEEDDKKNENSAERDNKAHPKKMEEEEEVSEEELAGMSKTTRDIAGEWTLVVSYTTLNHAAGPYRLRDTRHIADKCASAVESTIGHDQPCSLPALDGVFIRSSQRKQKRQALSQKTADGSDDSEEGTTEQTDIQGEQRSYDVTGVETEFDIKATSDEDPAGNEASVNSEDSSQRNTTILCYDTDPHPFPLPTPTISETIVPEETEGKC
jgi:hypothetical protein